MKLFRLWLVILCLAPSLVSAQSLDPWGPDHAEAGSVEAIRRYTTAEKFLPESVAYIPDSATVPSPEEVIGHLAGAPNELSDVATVHGYFRRLAATSDRVQVEVIGTTEEGREILLARISDAENLKNLDRYQEITARLADPRVTDRATADRLVTDGKPFYYITGGLHSTETGSPEMLMELAYRLAVSEKPEIRKIRKNMIVMITPVTEPDGRDRVVQWYDRHLKTSGPSLPGDRAVRLPSLLGALRTSRQQSGRDSAHPGSDPGDRPGVVVIPRAGLS